MGGAFAWATSSIARADAPAGVGSVLATGSERVTHAVGGV
jgi:hypothetical protein